MSAVAASGQSFSDSYTFLKAVRERDGAKVTELISAPGSVVINTRDRTNGEGALHYMVRARDITWLAFLLGKGARPDMQSNRGDTPLTLAAQIDAGSASTAAPGGVERDNGPAKALIPRHPAPRRADGAPAFSPPRRSEAHGQCRRMSALDYAKQDPARGRAQAARSQLGPAQDGTGDRLAGRIPPGPGSRSPTDGARPGGRIAGLGRSPAVYEGRLAQGAAS